MASDKPEGDILSEIQDVTTCTLCLEHFDQPHSLPCLHVYCGHCLDKLIVRTSEDGSFLCPVCRYQCASPPNGAEGFPRAFLQASLCETVTKFKELKLTGDPECSVCLKNGDTAPGSWFCSNCVETMCETCYKVHKQLLSTHNLIPCEKLDKDELQTAMKIVGEKCQKHGELIKFYCEPCQRLMCMICAILEPDSHPKKEILEVADQLRKKLETKNDEFRAKSQAYFEYIRKAKKSLGNNMRKVDAVKLEVDKNTQWLINQLKENRAFVHQQLDQMVKDQTTAVDGLIDTLTQEMSQVKGCTDHLKTTLNHGTSANIIETCNADMETLDKILQTLAPTNHQIPKFEPKIRYASELQIEGVMPTLAGARVSRRSLPRQERNSDINEASAGEECRTARQKQKTIEYRLSTPGPLYTECSTEKMVSDSQGYTFQLEEESAYRIHVKNSDGTSVGFIDPQCDSRLSPSGLFLEDDGELYIHLTSGFRKIYNHIFYKIY